MGTFRGTGGEQSVAEVGRGGEVFRLVSLSSKAHWLGVPDLKNENNEIIIHNKTKLNYISMKAIHDQSQIFSGIYIFNWFSLTDTMFVFSVF